MARPCTSSAPGWPAGHDDWATVDGLPEDASRQLAGNAWIGAMLAAMKSIADSRSRERMMKESMYSSGKLRSRLVAKDEEALFMACLKSIGKPAHLRRTPSQGKGTCSLAHGAALLMELGMPSAAACE